MKLSYNWLKEYVNIGVSVEELAKGLTMSGSEVEAVQEVDGDKVMSLEITANRADCLSIIGLAREVSTVFDKDLRLPEMSIPEKAVEKNGPKAECIVKNKKLCPRYTARIISSVHVKETSDKIKKRILAQGLRAVNNVVDITNFCLMETGQPLHAFDLDKLQGKKIIIREAVKGEKITTIDDVERELEAGMLVIADSTRPVAIAGVMGGRDTEVTESTKNILLESAYFDPISVRRTARTLGLPSDSSYRFERGVDKGMIAAASDRASGLIAAETGGKICSFFDVGKLTPGKVSIRFDIERAEKILGIPLEKKKVVHIFQRLGMTVSEEKGAKLVVKIPTFREDLKKEADLVEEVTRIYGYDNIPITIAKFIPQVKRKEHSRKVIEAIYEVLPALGLNEIMTYSLISEAATKRFSSLTESPISLVNPLSEEQKVLTPQLLDGMLRAISWNINRKNKDLSLFEVGKIYSRPGEKEEFLEVPTLCVSLTGFLRKNWQEGERLTNLYDLKGIIKTVLGKLAFPAVFSEKSVNGLVNCAGIALADGNVDVGFLGEVSTKLLNEYDIAQPVYICQIKLDKIIEMTNLEKHYHAIPRFPSSSRDISILCDQNLAAGEIHKAISETGEKIIREIELVDVYEGKQIPRGKKSLSYSIKYGLDNRTLTDEEVEVAHSRIKKTLTERLNVTFR